MWQQYAYSVLYEMFFPKADSAATEPYFPVFLRNVRYHAACTYNELWPCQIVRFWVPCKNTRLAYEEPWGSLRFKKQTMFCYVSKYLIMVICQQFTYTSTIYVQIFCDTLRLSVLIKLIFWAASAMTDIVSVSVIVEPLLPSLDFLRYLSNIQSCIITSGIRLVATIVTIVNQLAPSRNITIVY